MSLDQEIAPEWLRMGFNHNSAMQILPGGFGRLLRVNLFSYCF